MNIEGMTAEQFVAEAKRLRSAADGAERALMEFLYLVEQSPRVWSGVGLTYLQFIERADICRATRYDAWKRSRDVVGAEAVAAVGVNAAIAAGKLRDEASLRNVIGQAGKWEETNGMSISEQSAERLAHDEKMRHVGARHRGYLDLAAENERLREQLSEAKATIANLRVELRGLKRKAPKSKPARAQA